MVKISDAEASARYNIIHTPALVYFRKRVPLLYDGKFEVKRQRHQILYTIEEFNIELKESGFNF